MKFSFSYVFGCGLFMAMLLSIGMQSLRISDLEDRQKELETLEIRMTAYEIYTFQSGGQTTLEMQVMQLQAEVNLLREGKPQ